MPNHYRLKLWAVLLLSLGCVRIGHGQTTLAPGDLVIIGANSADLNSSDPDNFAFASLIDLAAGTQITFTDNGWQSATNSFRATEGTAIYKAPVGGVPKGRIISFSTGNHPDFTTTGSFLLATDGDQILAYQGSSSNPQFIYGLALRKSWSEASTSNTSALPLPLQNGVTAVAVPGCNAFMSQAARRRGLTAAVRSALNAASNWTGNTNTTPQGRLSWPLTDLVLEGVVSDADELQALQDLYVSTVGSGWTTRANWPAALPWAATLSNVDFRIWFGVQETNGDVTGLSLVSNHLTGSLPASLAKLQQLTTLACNNNLLSGNIPAALTQLPRLRTLVLSQNNLTGYVPQALANLPQLLVLRADNNQLTSLPDFSDVSPGRRANLSVDFSANAICFGLLEPNFSSASQPIIPNFSWVGQTIPDGEDVETQSTAEPIVLTCSFSGQFNRYQWQKKNEVLNTWPPISGATSAVFRISAPVAADAGRYRCQVTNDRVPNLMPWTKTTKIVLTAAATALPPDQPAADLNRNWTIERTYDGLGNAASNILAESKQFTDGLDRATQAQARSRATPHVFASETIYNRDGKPVVQTLAAPINNQSFAYKEKFTAVSSPTALGGVAEYSSVNFEDAHANNPDGLDVLQPGTLGYYYSTENQLEPLTPTTTHPFSLTEPAEGPLGGTKRAAGPGDAFRMGAGHEAKGREIPLLQEFDHYLTLRHRFVSGSTGPVSLLRQGTKSISVDGDGRESVVVANKEGQALVSCLTGAQYPPIEVTGFISTEPAQNNDGSAPQFLDIHIPATGEHRLNFTLGGTVRIINLNGGPGVSLTRGSGYLDSVDVALQPSPGNPATGAAYLLPGFYRLVSRPSATAAVTEQTQKFRYYAEYGNFSYTYYDNVGRVIATIAPNGVAAALGQQVTSAPGQAGHWSFNEASGAVAGDQSGNGLTGNLMNQFTWSSPTIAGGIPPSPAGGSSLVLNGQGYVRVGDVPALRMSNTMSMEAWIYPAANQDGIILNKENEYEIQRFADGSIQWAFQNTSPGWAWVNTGIVAPLNTWSHIGLTYDNGVVTAYLNGVQVGPRYQGSGPISTQGGEFWIGGRQCCGSFFQGAIDEVGVWNTVRSLAAGSEALLQYVTRNTYDTSSRLLATESTDEGRAEYVYARDGRLRFSQSALQRPTGRFSYSNYDELGRVVESGEYTPSGANGPVFQSLLPLSRVYEAEAASSERGGGTQISSTSATPAIGFVGSFNQPGAYLAFNVTVPTTGTYSVRVRYAAGDASALARTLPLYLQTALSSGYRYHVTFPATNAWDTWDTQTLELSLTQGSNRILFQQDRSNSDPANEGYVNVDYLKVISEQAPTSTSVLNIVEERAANNSLVAANCAQQNFVTYDQAFTGQVATPEPLLAGRTQEFTVGAVSKTSNDKVTTWYSYDELGRVTWMVQNIAGLGAKTLDYTYDFSGNVLEVAYQNGQADAFHHYYEYDQGQRLYKVYTSTDGAVRSLQAKYFYYLHGPIKRVELANCLQGVDYTYTLQGWLKSINHVNGRLDPGGDSPANNGRPKDLFGLTLDYFSGDYQSRAQAAVNLAGPSTPASPYRYDGTIRTASWRTAGSPVNHQSVYEYDAKSQLTQSNFGSLTIAGTPTNSTYLAIPSQAYKEGNLSYDANGNMQGLRRTDKDGTVTDNFSYEYAAGTNRLSAVHGGGSPSGAAVMDYDYDALGQLTRQRDEQGQRYLTYDVTGKTTGMYQDAAHQLPIVEFAYDDRGFRVSKKSYGTGASTGQVRTTYYVRDAAGNVMSVYEQGTQTSNAAQRSEVPLYGSSRVGVFTHLDDGTATGTDDARYELNDHLGDARVVFHRPTTLVTTASMELTKEASQEDGQWPGLAQARRYSSSAHQGVTTPSNYVAFVAPPVAGSRTEGPHRTFNVEKGDTLTFSAWAYLMPVGIIAGGGNSSRLHVLPILTPGAAPAPGKASADNIPSTTPRQGWFGRLTAGVALVGWGGKHPVTPTAARGTGADVWLRYRVFDESGNLVSEQYQYQSNRTAQTWQELRTAVRVQQAGTVEVAIGSDDPNWEASFDDLRLEQTGGMIVQEQHQYAYGSPLVGLNYAVGNKRYRYGYQGQYAEKDAETGFESFELRLYNDRIGRWTSNDPKGQFSSPYVGMGNNPISGVDPDGGWTPAGIGTLVGAAVGGTIGGIKGYEQGGTAGMWGGIVAGATLGGIAGGLAGYGIGKLGNVDWNIAIQSGSGTARGLNFLYDKVDKSHVFDGTDITIHNVGVHLAINNNPGKTHWIQTAITNVPIDGHASNERYVDNGGNKKNPEYWNRKYFEDTPNRTLGYNTNAPGTEAGFYFSAETSLVRKRADGSYKILKTIRYGFSYDRVTKEVITENLRFHRASQAHKNLIRNFGK